MCPPPLDEAPQPPGDPPKPRDGGAVWTLIIPFACTWRETLLRLLTLPRGIPMPAVPFFTKRRWGTPLLTGMKGRPTVTVAVPRVGGCGTGNRFGGFFTGTTGYQVVNAPGAHIHPYPGTNCQLP